MIELHTLGTVDLRHSDGREIRPVLAQPKRLALLAYLAVHRPQAFARRDQVLSLLWPDQDDKHARAALNRAIYYLRRSLGESVLVSRGDAIGLSPDSFWCDAAEFEAAASEGRHERAVELYRGDLLEGFHVSDAIEFERWLEEKRDRLREVARQSAWSLADAAQRAGDAGAAAQWARWAVARAPYDEASLQRLIKLLDASGDRAGAVREYDLFVRRLQADLELSPSPETRALLEAIRGREVGKGAAELSVNGSAGVAAIRNGHSVVADHVAAAVTVPTPSVDAAVASPDAPPSGETPPQPPSMSRATRRRFSRRGIAAAGALSVMAVGAPLAALLLRPVPDESQIVVALIENHTGFDTMDPLARQATDRIASGLVDPITTANAAIKAKRPLRVIQSDDGASDARPFALGDRAGTVVHGGLYREGGALELRVGVTKVREGQTWEIPPITVSPESSEDALGELGQRAAGAVYALVMFGPTFMALTPPPTYEAVFEYEKARWDPPRAVDRMLKAAALDPTFTWPLLDVRWRLTAVDPAAADSIVLDLQQRRGTLNPLQDAVLSGQLAIRIGDRQGYYEAMRVASRIAPRWFLEEFARSAWGLNRPREALTLLDELDENVPEGRISFTWPLRTQLLHELHRYRDELSVTRSVREAYPEDPNALASQIGSLAALGQIEQLRSLVDSAMASSEKSPDAPGHVLMEAARELRAHGQTEESKSMAGRAADWFENTPPQFAGEASLLRDSRRADALYLAGELDAAQALNEQLVTQHPRWRTSYYGALGAIAARKHDRATAEAYIAALSDLSVPTEAEPYDLGLARARIAVVLGDPDRALAFLLEGYGGVSGVDLHVETDFEWVVQHDKGFQEFARPKG